MTAEPNNSGKNARRTSSADRRAMTGGVARAYYRREGIVFHAPDSTKADRAADDDAMDAATEAVPAGEGVVERIAEPAAESSVEPVTEPSVEPAVEPAAEPMSEPAPVAGPAEPAAPAEAADVKPPAGEDEPASEQNAAEDAAPGTIPGPPAEAAEAKSGKTPGESTSCVHTERSVSPQEAAAAARRSSHAFVEVDPAPPSALGASLLNPIWAAAAQRRTRQAAEEVADDSAMSEDAARPTHRADSASADDEDVLHLEAEPIPSPPDGAFETVSKRVASFLNNRRAKAELEKDVAEEEPDASDDELPAGADPAAKPALDAGAPATGEAATCALPPTSGEDAPAALPAGEEPPVEEAPPAALTTGTWRDNAFGRFVNRLLAAFLAFFSRLGRFIAARWRHFRENPGPIRSAVRDWFNRVAGAAHEGSFSSQPEEYASGRSRRDFVCNILGTASFGALFPLLTVVVTQIVGVELAGMFSLSFVAGSLFLIIANFGMRPYQVSDINEEHSFADYRVHRFCTCLIMAVVGLAYCGLRGYSGTMLSISLGVYGFKMIEGMADAYEGRLQQKDKLYLAGISQTIRSVGAFIVFTVVLLISHNLAAACISLPITGLVTFFLFTFPLAKLETPKSRPFKVERVVDLFKQCTPLFVSLFLYTLIDYMPVFVMEGVLSYDNQLYYNAMYFPAQAIAVGLSVVYKPQLLRIAEYWNDKTRRRHFDMITFAIFALIALVTALVVVVMAWIGIPIMSFLYGLDFEQFRGLVIIFLIAGGVTSYIDFIYQLSAVLRRQQNIMQNYLITFGFSLFVPTLLVNFTGLPGAVIGYLIIMCILLVLTGSEYIRIRMDIAQEEADDAAQVAQHQEQQRRRWTSRFRVNKER